MALVDIVTLPTYNLEQCALVHWFRVPTLLIYTNIQNGIIILFQHSLEFDQETSGYAS